MFRNFFSLTKPGIIFGNVITALGGFFLAAKGQINFSLLIFMLVGVSLVIASGCVFNNCIDRDIDKLMKRTQNRVMAKGLISMPVAIMYGFVVGALGIAALYFGTNLLVVIIALIGLFVYVVVYTLWLKRNSIYGTLVGSVSGAVPPVIGYCAVTNKFDVGAFILFLILSLWQMPHSFAIAIYRYDDYLAASIPVLPVKRGIPFTKLSMLLYTIAFAIATLMLTLLGYTGIGYFIVALIVGVYWSYIAISGFYTHNNKQWARKMFVFSIFGLIGLCIMMSVNFKV